MPRRWPCACWSSPTRRTTWSASPEIWVTTGRPSPGTTVPVIVSSASWMRSMSTCTGWSGACGHFRKVSGDLVLFGVTPEGTVVGQQVSDQTIEKVSAEIQRIEPRTFPSIQRVPVEGDIEVIVVVARPGSTKPYVYKRTAYRRVGNTTLAMSTEEYNRVLFERMHAEQRWENQPATGWSVDDLDAVEIRKTVREAIWRSRLEDPGTREPAELLQGMKLVKDGVLLRAAVVLFGNAFTLLSAAERFLRDTLPIAGRFERDRFDRIDETPLPATRNEGGDSKRSLPSRLLDRGRLCGPGGVRRPPRSDLNGFVALRFDPGAAICTSRVHALEPLDRPCVLSSWHYSRRAGCGGSTFGEPGSRRSAGAASQ